MGKAHIVVPRVILGVAVLAIIAAIFAPNFQQRRSSPTTLCKSQLKAVGTCMQIYASDCDDRLPLQNWQTATLPYVKDLNLYTCPVIREEEKKWGYAMNFETLGRKLGELDEETILLFEIDALAPNVVANDGARSTNRHGEGSNVCFMDTRVKRLP